MCVVCVPYVCLGGGGGGGGLFDCTLATGYMCSSVCLSECTSVALQQGICFIIHKQNFTQTELSSVSGCLSNNELLTFSIVFHARMFVKFIRVKI